MIKVSVIIPSRNSIRFYRECMESIREQTERDIEIIPVDAQSDDGTWEMIVSFAEKDERIHPIRSERKSYGYQCNVGIRTAKGKYVAIVESDDYVSLQMFEKLYQAAEKDNLDWVKADFDFFVDLSEKQRFFLHYPLLPSAKKENYGRALHLSQDPEMIFRDLNLWNGIYRKDFLEKGNIRFQETDGAAFQDISFVLQTFMVAKRFMYVTGPSYCYRQDNQMSSIYNPAGLRYVQDEFRYMVDFFERNAGKYDEYKVIVLKKLFGDLKGAYSNAPRLADMEEEQRKSFCQFRTFFKEQYGRLSVSERMEEELPFAVFIQLFLNEPEQFDLLGHREREMIRSARRELVRIADQNPVVIAGAGEWGSGLYAFLKNNGLDSVQAFCDNASSMAGKEHMGLQVCAVEEACKHWKDAVFFVAGGAYYREIKRQLLHLGIRTEQIIRSPLIPLHEALEERVWEGASDGGR